MKKLLFIVCLMAGALFANGADAAIGSPMRNARASVSVSTVRVAATCTTCGRVSRPVHVRPVIRHSCTTCGHRIAHHGFGHRSMHHGFGYRHVRHGFGHRSVRHHAFRGHRSHTRRFACTRCGR